MAATSDRARFYLEQYVPELQEFEQKGIFSRDEISAITSKRSDFEHILNARGSTPADYARYAAYEMNLDSLRKKRCKRLGIKGTKTFSGQRTVFFVFDRATKKFPGDMGLWIKYITFCRKEDAVKKLARVFTAVLRLHPREWSLWVLAAKYYAESHGDMSTARSYLQRGIRFCRDEKKLYLEYAKLEMVYLAKLAARRKLLGLDGKAAEPANEEDEDMVRLPTITAEDIDPDVGKGVEEVNEDALKRLEKASAFTGAIPIAIFEAAMKQFRAIGPEVAEDFFDLVATFSIHAPATLTVLQHILDYLHTNAAGSSEDVICQAKHQLFGIDSQAEEFPAALGKALACVRQDSDKMSSKQSALLAEKAVLMLLPFLVSSQPDKAVADEDVIRALEASIKKYLSLLTKVTAQSGRKSGPAAMVVDMRKRNLEDPAADAIERLMSDAGLG